jgi:hypothetical protein
VQTIAQDAVEYAAHRLDAIPVERFIITGIKTVHAAVIEAWDSIYAAQRALMSVDAEAFKAAVIHCTSAVKNALQVAACEHAWVEAMENLDEAEAILKGIEETALEHSIRATQKKIVFAHKACNDPKVAILQEATQQALQDMNSTVELLESELEKKRLILSCWWLQNGEGFNLLSFLW